MRELQLAEAPDIAALIRATAAAIVICTVRP